MNAPPPAVAPGDALLAAASSAGGAGGADGQAAPTVCSRQDLLADWLTVTRCGQLQVVFAVVVFGTAAQALNYLCDQLAASDASGGDVVPFAAFASSLCPVMPLAFVTILMLRRNLSPRITETLLAALAALISASSMFALLCVGDPAFQQYAVQQVAVIWRQLGLVAAARTSSCVALLAWITLCECIVLGASTSDTDPVPGRAFASSFLLSMLYAIIGAANFRRLACYYEAEQKLARQAKVTEQLLGMMSDYVLVLGPDGDTIQKSDVQLNFLIQQDLRGMSLTATLLTEAAHASFAEAAARTAEPGRHGAPTLLASQLRSGGTGALGVDLVLLRSIEHGHPAGSLMLGICSTGCLPTHARAAAAGDGGIVDTDTIHMGITFASQLSAQTGDDSEEEDEEEEKEEASPGEDGPVEQPASRSLTEFVTTQLADTATTKAISRERSPSPMSPSTSEIGERRERNPSPARSRSPTPTKCFTIQPQDEVEAQSLDVDAGACSRAVSQASVSSPTAFSRSVSRGSSASVKSSTFGDIDEVPSLLDPGRKFANLKPTMPPVVKARKNLDKGQFPSSPAPPVVLSTTSDSNAKEEPQQQKQQEQQQKQQKPQKQQQQQKDQGAEAAASNVTPRSSPKAARKSGSSAEKSPSNVSGVSLGGGAQQGTSKERFRVGLQKEYGPQSKRGGASQDQLSILDFHPHAKTCFERFASNEEALCGEWAVFYHSYSYAALIYELHAAVAAALFRFPSSECSLPRIIMADFEKIPDADALIGEFEKRFSAGIKDHTPEYRAVAISAMCSLAALGPEVSTPTMFLAGFSQEDLNFTKVLEKSLASCYIPKQSIKRLAAEIIALAEKYGLDVSKYGGKPCESGKAGHLLQIFVRRHFLDELAYSSHPYGEVDDSRQPISSWLGSNVSTQWGQARIVVNPRRFLSTGSVCLRMASADPGFHYRRPRFQEDFIRLINQVLRDPQQRLAAATGIYGGTPPDWNSGGPSGSFERCISGSGVGSGSGKSKRLQKPAGCSVQ